MSVVFRCDAPGCERETGPEPNRYNLRAPPGWFVFGHLCACSTEHYLAAQMAHDASVAAQASADAR